MRAAVYRGADQLVTETVPVPSIGRNELLVKVAACGVCRTDLHIFDGEVHAPRLPLTPGHEIVGRVVRRGPDARRFSEGARVGLPWLGWTCGRCDHCLSGRENLCETARFTGLHHDGGYATHAIARADFALRLPDGFDDLAAAPLLCGGVIGYRSLKRSGIQTGGRLGLYGFGASALITLQIARHWGCRIFVATRSPSEQERARSLGAEWTGGTGDTPPEPLDAAITFAPSGDVVRAALRACDRGATVAINAIHLDRLPEMPYEELWWERRLASVANFTRADAAEFLALAAQIPVRTSFETHALDEANVALARLARGEVQGAAVLVP